jgi:hypothetical protein
MKREEIACVSGLTLATVKRDLRLAEAWLRRDLTGHCKARRNYPPQKNH